MKLMLATLVVALVASGAAASCRVTTTCGSVGECDLTKCPNCRTVNSCVPNRRATCPRRGVRSRQLCFSPSTPNGCGGYFPAQSCRCASGRPCDEDIYGGRCCPATCSVDVGGTHVQGTCAFDQPLNTLSGVPGNCPPECGQCYLPKPTCPTTCTAHVGQTDVTGTCASSAPANTYAGGPCSGTCGTCYISCPSTCTATVNNVVTTGTCASASNAPANTIDGGQGSCPGTCGKCYVPKPTCPTTCTVDLTDNQGDLIATFTGTCASSRPANTISGGQGDCPTTCGECYIPSRATGLCSTNGGPCAREGKCGCFPTTNGANCASGNFLEPKPVPLPDNGGGCPENMCNAVAAKGGTAAACCPQDCSA